jgi:DNA-binding transcriptional ArsR family regulator
MSTPLPSDRSRRVPQSLWGMRREGVSDFASVVPEANRQFAFSRFHAEGACQQSRASKASQFETLDLIRKDIICNRMVTRFDDLDGPVFDALGDPTRRAILDLLRENERAAGEIASHFPASRPAIAKHVRILKRAGLVAERSEGRHRYYALNSRPLAAVDHWLQPYRAFWAARLVALKQLVESEEKKNGSE